MSAVTVPQLTIELPWVVEEPLEKMLASFQWPSKGSGQLPQPQMLSLRHRIPPHTMTEDESSVRFLESFWPRRPTENHVLVLAPHVEVSPQFFHCKLLSPNTSKTLLTFVRCQIHPSAYHVFTLVNSPRLEFQHDGH